jgi:hypothetical protein
LASEFEQLIVAQRAFYHRMPQSILQLTAYMGNRIFKSLGLHLARGINLLSSINRLILVLQSLDMGEGLSGPLRFHLIVGSFLKLR